MLSLTFWFDHSLVDLCLSWVYDLIDRIVEHISVNRKSIEKKLAELLKLCRWDRFENHFAIENFRRRRIKLKNIIKEYTVRCGFVTWIQLELLVKILSIFHD